MSLRVVGIAGSLRKGSYNRALLRVAQGVLPEGMTIEIAEIASIPLYDGDLEARGVPDPVRDLKKTVAAADALLIATPEYNYSVPGVLKNAIDWLSRKPDPPLFGKPAAILGASQGNGGTMRSQLHLRQIAVYVNLLILAKPEVYVSKAQESFDDAGNLRDESIRESVHALLVALEKWTRALGKT